MFFDLPDELLVIFQIFTLDLADTLEEIHLEVPNPYVNVPEEANTFIGNSIKEKIRINVNFLIE